MKPFAALAAVLALTSLAACSPSSPPEPPKADIAAAPAPPTPAPAAPTPAPEPAAAVAAPAGVYKLDPNHASMSFKIGHLGLSNYVARFSKFDATVNLDPANPAASSVSLTVEPGSIKTDYPGDYKAGHAQSPYKTWDEDLAQSPKFFNTAQYPQATFKSTKVEQTAPGKYRVTGDLTLVGQTHPVTLDATVVGSVAQHPFNQRGAMGLSATGTFKRSAFGITHLLQPPLVGDDVTIQFEGEFQQAEAAPATPAT